MTRDNGEYWLAPKRCGYGAGLPLTWQGWLVCLVYCMAMTLAASLLVESTILGFVAVTGTATAAFLLVCARRTRGGWRWRWSGAE